MSYYYHSSPEPSELRFIDDELYNSWVTTNNPKANWWTRIPDPPTPNHYWNGTDWIERAPYIPQEISRLQGLLILERNGLLTQCEALVQQSTVETKLAWANASTFNRQSPTLLTLATALGLNDQQLDQLFIDGSQIHV